MPFTSWIKIYKLMHESMGEGDQWHLTMDKLILAKLILAKLMSVKLIMAKLN